MRGILADSAVSGQGGDGGCYHRVVRVASLSPAVTEILFRLGAGGSIVCRDQFSLFPEDAAEIPVLKGHADIDPASLVPFGAEVVFTETVIQEKLAAILKAAGQPVIHLDPRTLDQVLLSVRTIGAVLGLEKEASALVLSLQREMNAVRAKARLLPRRPKVYVEEWHAPPMASGNWVAEVVKHAGGEAFPIPAGQLSRPVTLAEVARFDPDLVVISWCGAGSLADKTLLLEREGWGNLRAAAAGNVRVIDDSLLNRPGPRLAEGAARIYGWLFEMLH